MYIVMLRIVWISFWLLKITSWRYYYQLDRYYTAVMRFNARSRHHVPTSWYRRTFESYTDTSTIDPKSAPDMCFELFSTDALTVL